MRACLLLVVCACAFAPLCLGLSAEVEATTSRSSKLGTLTASPSSFRATFWRPEEAGGEKIGLEVLHQVADGTDGRQQRIFSIVGLHASKPRRALLYYATPVHAQDVHRLQILDTGIKYPDAQIADIDTRNSEVRCLSALCLCFLAGVLVGGLLTGCGAVGRD